MRRGSSFLFLLSATGLSQNPPSNFKIGAIVGYDAKYNEALHNTYEESGMNTIAQYADEISQPIIEAYDVIAYNPGNTDWIHYYSTGLYSKWEAEENQTNPLKVGFKHLYGDTITYNDTLCWTTSGLIGYADSIIYGPHYKQWKTYKRWTGDQYVDFIARYNMALNNNNHLPLNTEVCRITVRVRHPKFINGVWNDTVHVDTMKGPVTLKVSDFDPNGHFKPIYFSSDPQQRMYNYLLYPPHLDESKMVELPSEHEITYDDSNPHNGVEFCLEWLGNNQLTLYIDNIEVYDYDGWNDYITSTALVTSRINSYAQNYSNWSNLKYWYANDEPSSRDAFIPMRTVDSILANANSAPIITHYYAGRLVNGENLLQKFVEITKPKKLLIDIYPFSPAIDPPLWKRFDTLRTRFTEAYSLDTAFYYTPQAFGNWDPVNNQWSVWRRPDTSEFKAPIMLALAYGSKGLVFSDYDTHNPNPIDSAIVGGPPNYEPQSLWYVIRNNLVPRLQGKLGDKLLTLKYTNQFISARYIIPTDNPNPSTYNYLTIPYNQTASNMNWHVGFFNRNSHQDDNYFFLVNLLTETEKSVIIKITPPVPGYTNYRFRNFEGYFDTTFIGSQFIYTLSHPAGEGYLFQVAPVVKYGGKLVYSETVGNQTLYDDMTIENGATLTVSGIYNANANITVKSGGRIVTNQNGTINFSSGKHLIIEGAVQLTGSSVNNKLNLHYTGTDKAIVIKPGSSFTMNYCNITGAYQGINTETGTQSYVNISNSNIGAVYSGISLVASSLFEGFQTPPTPTIQNCNITASISGINVSNYSSVLLKANTFTNCGITVSNVASAFIQSNNISLGSNTSLPGIFFNNSGGYIRSNTIKNRVNGIQIANSSPDCGGNLVENNYKHGLYIAGSSIPNLVGLVQTNPPTYYPLAGYNTIRNNGNNTEENEYDENDGSEIYFSFSDAYLGTERNPGCNQISDDRTATPSMITIWLLSGIYGNEPHFLDAIYNYWGTTTPTGSRFGIATNFYPYYTSMCSPNGGGEEEKLVLKTSSGEIVDSISAAEGEPENFTMLEVSYSEADNLFATGNVTQAKPLYEQIVTGNYTSEEKLSAYNKLYTIGNLTGEDEAYFTSLQTTFEDIANNEADTLIKKVYEQNAIKCDVSKEEYVTAINKFDNIVQQNPNSEEAVYAEIDILTTALNIDTTNPGLGKLGGGKYLVKGTSDYLSKLNDILQSKFGINSEDSKNIIPKEYSLHQNYPNPFNPKTTIKFDLPNDGLVQLEVYDILGRRITTLVNDYKSAGSYEHQFDASQLASGVYIYKLQAGNFVSSKKMILLK